MGNICGLQNRKGENYSEEGLTDRLTQVSKKQSVNVLYDIDKSTCFKSEIGPQDQMVNTIEATELDESSLRFIIDVARPNRSTKQFISDI